jgi:hypothetical protein
MPQFAIVLVLWFSFAPNFFGLVFPPLALTIEIPLPAGIEFGAASTGLCTGQPWETQVSAVLPAQVVSVCEMP